ncbi:MAG: class I SAM-dependent methyltransferase [Pseudomonadota bacterium]
MDRDGSAADQDINPFSALHYGLLREGPGSDETTLRALGLTGLSGALDIADMGAGPGSATLLLTQALPGSRVVAVDLHQPSLNALVGRAQAAGVEGQIETAKADMADAGFVEGSLDLIWCENAIYFVGVERALRLWQPLLKPGGRVVFSDEIWLTDDRPDDVKLVFANYPEMTTKVGVEAHIRAAGFRVIDSFLQPKSDWQNYLGPLGARAAALRPQADETLKAVLDGAETEVALFERHSTAYGYQMFVVEPA